MDPLSRLFLALVGAVFGASMRGSAGRLGGALVGGLVALGAFELNTLRARLRSLDEAVAQIRQELLKLGTTKLPPVVAAPVATAFAPGRERSASTQAQQRPRPLSGSAEFPPVRWLREFLMGGNTVVRVGIVILFFGVAFLLRYLAEHSHVPIEWRLSGIVLGGMALLVVGWCLRRTRSGYALALQGGAIGILYLTVFAGLRLYGVLPAAIAFPILVAIAVLAASLAVLQNALSLALLGVAGGFLAPVLASAGAGNHVVLFSYYAILNAGIVAMAWFKAWRPLNVVGFVFTFGIGTSWGVLQYRPELFASTEPFLLLFWLFYLVIAVLFTFRQTDKAAGFIDVTVVFGTPIVVFALQSAMLHERLFALAYSALMMSAVYLASAWLLQRRWRESRALLKDSFIAIGVGFLTLAVPLALDARWNVAAWSLEGAALIWVGCRQRRVLARVAGALLNLACGVIAAKQFDLGAGHAFLPLADYVGFVLQSVAAVVSACLLHRFRQQLRVYEPAMAAALFWWGLWWWSAGGVSELSQLVPMYRLAGSLILFTVTTLLCSEIQRRINFMPAKVAALLQLPIMLLLATIAAGTINHPAAAGGSLAWSVAFAGLWVVMYRLEGVARGPVANGFNAGATWLFCALMSWEAAWEVNRLVAGSDAWPTTTWVVIPLVMLWLLPRLVTRVAWPFAKNRDAYLFLVGVGLAVYVTGWSVVANVRSVGDFAPLPYCPVLNPLDLGQAFVLLLLYRYWRFLRRVGSVGLLRIDRRVPVPALGALTFLWLNAILLRTLHQWFGVAYGWDELLASTLVQTSLSIFWALLAFLMMVVATRRRWRIVWLVGAALLGVVIGKLFLVDLSRVGSIERIVSFVGVGLLMLVVGYFSPLPPPLAREEVGLDEAAS